MGLARKLLAVMLQMEALESCGGAAELDLKIGLGEGRASLAHCRFWGEL